MSAPDRAAPFDRRGLCPACAHVKVIQSAKGSTFYLCERARTDPRFVKYPPQPVLVCAGYERYALPKDGPDG